METTPTFLRRQAKSINFVLFQGGWFACVGGAGLEWIWLGPLFVMIAMVFQGLLLQRISRGEVLFVLAGGIIGTAIDTGMIALHIYDPVRSILPWPLAPVWIIALWVIFTGSFRLSLGWLQGHYVYACLLGALGGPLSYSAGQRLGACTINPDFLRGYAALGIIWGISIPVLFFISAALASREEACSPLHK